MCRYLVRSLQYRKRSIDPADMIFFKSFKIHKKITIPKSTFSLFVSQSVNQKSLNKKRGVTKKNLKGGEGGRPSNASIKPTGPTGSGHIKKSRR